MSLTPLRPLRNPCRSCVVWGIPNAAVSFEMLLTPLCLLPLWNYCIWLLTSDTGRLRTIDTAVLAEMPQTPSYLPGAPDTTVSDEWPLIRCVGCDWYPCHRCVCWKKSWFKLQGRTCCSFLSSIYRFTQNLRPHKRSWMWNDISGIVLNECIFTRKGIFWRRPTFFFAVVLFGSSPLSRQLAWASTYKRTTMRKVRESCCDTWKVGIGTK
jgi:hypothetical protein